MTEFVLLHGAWHGGWCWSRVASILRARGHRVTTPTQTGLGERSHLLTADITLTTFCEDLRLHMEFEDVQDAVLVGHSFGGSAISYAAERVPDRIRRLVYLDATLVMGGETPFTNMPSDVVALRRQLAADSSGGLSLPVPPAAAMGITAKDDTAWVERMMTPHPLRTFETLLDITAPPGAGLAASYIVCTDPIYTPLAPARARAQALGWAMPDIATGHDAMITAPEALADLLEAQ